VEGATEAKDPNQGSLKELEEVLPFLQLPTMTNHAKALLDHLRKTVVKDPDAAAALIRTWMEEV
jgi:flagellar biosynthesis/type III secretory pathway M-ring protein FliF/YscJ